MEKLLEVEGLSTSFATWEGEIRAVQDLYFYLDAGETLALVGESGCGKSVTARSVMGLYTGSRVTQSGTIRFKGEDLSAAPPSRRAALRGGAMAMIFQEPMAAFDPLASIGEQMIDARMAHAPRASQPSRSSRPSQPVGDGAAPDARDSIVRGMAASDYVARDSIANDVIAALRSVGIPDPELRLRDYPHRLSGGMLQRVLIAIALMNEPALLVADEPTTALDVTIQAQVLRLIRDLRRDKGAGVLFITHDLGVVAEIADRIHVMYAGRIVEKATVEEFFGAAGPLHPYGEGLLASRIRRDATGGELPSIPGTVPRPLETPEGCRFAPRCAKAGPRCAREEPRLAPVAVAGGAIAAGGTATAREVACWLHQGGVR